MFELKWRRRAKCLTGLSCFKRGGKRSDPPSSPFSVFGANDYCLIENSVPFIAVFIWKSNLLTTNVRASLSDPQCQNRSTWFLWVPIFRCSRLQYQMQIWVSIHHRFVAGINFHLNHFNGHMQNLSAYIYFGIKQYNLCSLNIPGISYSANNL